MLRKIVAGVDGLPGGADAGRAAAASAADDGLAALERTGGR